MSNVSIKKVKTNKENTWDLQINGTTVGMAKAEYKTKTQRAWTGEITVPLADGTDYVSEHICQAKNGGSVKAVITAFTAELAELDINVPEAVKPARKAKKSKYPAKLLRSAITTENAIELSTHYGYGTAKKNGDERTGVEQAKYLRQLVEREAAAAKAAPAMSDLVGQPGLGKDGEPEVVTTSLSDHYAD